MKTTYLTIINGSLTITLFLLSCFFLGASTPIAPPTLSSDVCIVSVNLPAYAITGKQTLRGVLQNTGSSTINSLNLHYQIVGSPTIFSRCLTALAIEPNTSYHFTHPDALHITKGQQEIKVWVDSINGYNDTLNKQPDTSFSHSIIGATTLYKQQGLVEHFTNINCSICDNHNPLFFERVNSHGNNLAAISYQVYWWEGDIFFQNEADYQFRTEYYYGPEMPDFSNVQGTPRTMLHGGNDVILNNMTDEDLVPYTDLASPVLVTVNESLSGNMATVNIDITPSETLTANNLKAYVFAVEAHVVYNEAPGLNGEMVLEHLMRDMLTVVPVSKNEGVTTTINTNYSFPTYTDASQLRTIVVVQDDDDKAVYQVFKAPMPMGSNSNASPQVLESNSPCPSSECVTVQTKALLAGAYNTSSASMRTDLLTGNLLPLNQPYNTAPWYYDGDESMNNYNDFPSNTVDWVLLEIRHPLNAAIVVEQRAALLLSDGQIVGIDGFDGLTFYNLVPNTAYYVVLRHRNHLDVMSATTHTLPNTISIDFTKATNVSDGTGQVSLLATNTYGLFAGDFNGDGVIIVGDYNLYAEQIATINTFIAGDCSLDANVTVADFNLYQPNASRIGVSAVRYD